MEELKTVVCTHELQGDTGQDFLSFCAAEVSQPVCVCVCVWGTWSVGLWLLLANATGLTSECPVLVSCFYVRGYMSCSCVSLGCVSVSLGVQGPLLLALSVEEAAGVAG